MEWEGRGGFNTGLKHCITAVKISIHLNKLPRYQCVKIKLQFVKIIIRLKKLDNSLEKLVDACKN